MDSTSTQDKSVVLPHEKLPQITIVGPTYPYRGGIAHYSTLLANALGKVPAEVQFVSFIRQYPRWLYRRSDQDPTQKSVNKEVEYVLDSINPLTWWQTARRIVSFSPELLLINWWVPFWAPHWAYLTWYVKAKNPQIKIVFLCHNVLPHESSPIDRLLTRVALRLGDYFVVHAKEQQMLLQEIIPMARTLTVPMPSFEGEFTTNVEKISLNTPFPKLLFAGLVREYKGLDILLQAIPWVLKEMQVHVYVVGEFWDDPKKYRDLIKALKIDHAVTLHDQYVPDETLAAYLEAADVVVLPYRHATQSAIAQWSLSMGTPVIVSAVGGLKEAVQDGINGLLVPPEDHQALAEKIVAYFQTNLKEQLSRNLQQKPSPYLWENFVDDLMRFCNLT